MNDSTENQMIRLMEQQNRLLEQQNVLLRQLGDADKSFGEDLLLPGEKIGGD